MTSKQRVQPTLDVLAFEVQNAYYICSTWKYETEKEIERSKEKWQIKEKNKEGIWQGLSRKDRRSPTQVGGNVLHWGKVKKWHGEELKILSGGTYTDSRGY